jgi:hypothetical protein
MVRVPYLIENDSTRSDHRVRREVYSARDAGCKIYGACPADPGIYEVPSPGQIDWTVPNCASA